MPNAPSKENSQIQKEQACPHFPLLVNPGSLDPEEPENCHFVPFLSLAVTWAAASRHRRKRKQGKD
jgi:hypothetical protein